MTLRQRQPRETDETHCRYIASLPCEICAGIDVQVAHIRTSNISIGKRDTGGGERPSDKWTLPLCVAHHAEQHTMNELAFWKKYGIDPFMRALFHWAASAALRAAADLRKRKVTLIRQGGARKSKLTISGRERPKRKATIPSRPFPTGRGFQ